MVFYRRMQVSVEEAREKLPELIGLVERGELIRIKRDGIPVAEAFVCWNYLRWLSCERMQVSVEEAREKLPELITLAERGELVTITLDGIPVADLAPSKAEKSGLDPRPEV
jgi:antitoxin (DNA-binding transcriptional repressor) of toxin-antitoxin stability system